MNDTHNQPHTGASLTAEERAAMKREFVSFMQANPPVRAKARTGIRSPYFPHLMRIPAFAVAFLALMGGTAYAAEQSLEAARLTTARGHPAHWARQAGDITEARGLFHFIEHCANHRALCQFPPNFPSPLGRGTGTG